MRNTYRWLLALLRPDKVTLSLTYYNDYWTYFCSFFFCFLILLFFKYSYYLLRSSSWHLTYRFFFSLSLFCSFEMAALHVSLIYSAGMHLFLLFRMYIYIYVQAHIYIGKEEFQNAPGIYRMSLSSMFFFILLSFSLHRFSFWSKWKSHGRSDSRPRDDIYIYTPNALPIKYMLSILQSPFSDMSICLF